MEVIIPIGISGSGKTRLYEKRYKDYEIISPDLIRKELTGDISNQKRNKEVFQIVDKRVNECIEEGKSFYYDATNVNPEYRRIFVNQFKDKDIKVIYMVLPADIKVSQRRIFVDLMKKVDRPKVPYNALLRQYTMYTQSVKGEFKDENVQEIVYLKLNELD